MSFSNWLKHNQLVMMGAVLGGSLVLATVLAANSLKHLRPNTLDVTGAAEQRVTSDRVIWTLEPVGRGKDSKTALAMLNKNREAVKAYFLKQGLAANSLQAGVVNQVTFYERDAKGYETRVIDTIEFRQPLTVTSSAVDKVTTLSTGVSSLLGQGGDVSVQPPQYFYTPLNTLKVKLLSAATGNAKARAQAVAQSAGNHVGVLTSASTGVFQITPADSTEVSDWGVNDTSTVAKKVTAVVNASFELE
ncbi:MAG: SIMPL domain-containing protein [Vampirovibrionales bacterium]|nr:SIMPL domain-containing protein [Vampirovibrionales bacterium]